MMAPINFTDVTDEPATDNSISGDSGGLTGFQIYITILFVLAFLCLVTGIINLIIHRLEQTRRLPFQMKLTDYNQKHLDTVSATVNQHVHHNGHSKGKRPRSVKVNRSAHSVKKNRAVKSVRTQMRVVKKMKSE